MSTEKTKTSTTDSGDIKDFLLDKRHLLLSVEVNTKEQIQELLRWMYGTADQRPLSATLNEIFWNKIAVDADTAEALNDLAEKVVEWYRENDLKKL